MKCYSLLGGEREVRRFNRYLFVGWGRQTVVFELTSEADFPSFVTRERSERGHFKTNRVAFRALQGATLLRKMQAKRVLGDRGYVGEDIRTAMIETGAKPAIPPKKNARFVYPYSRKTYKERNVIERMINRSK